MRITLTQPVFEDAQGVHAIFEVHGDGREPGAEGVFLGGGNMTHHSQSTPEDIAEAVWEEAEAIKEAGLASWELHNQVAPLLKAMMEGQEG